MEFDIEIDGLQHQLNTLEEMQLQWGEFAGYAVGSDVDYAIYVEYGTYKMPANRAMRNAMRDTMSRVESFAARADSADELGRMIAEDIASRWRSDVWVDTGKLRDSITVVEV